MTTRCMRWLTLLLALLFAVTLAATTDTAPTDSTRLPLIGSAPSFALDSSRGPRVTLADLRGKVLALTFVFTTCTDTCPILTAKLAELAETGRLEYHERLRAQVPDGVLDMLRVPGVGPRTVRLLHETLGIDSLDGLRAAAAEGRIFREWYRKYDAFRDANREADVN